MLSNLAQKVELLLLQEFIDDVDVIQGFPSPTSLFFAVFCNLTQ